MVASAAKACPVWSAYSLTMLSYRYTHDAVLDGRDGAVQVPSPLPGTEGRNAREQQVQRDRHAHLRAHSRAPLGCAFVPATTLPRSFLSH